MAVLGCGAIYCTFKPHALTDRLEQFRTHFEHNRLDSFFSGKKTTNPDLALVDVSTSKPISDLSGITDSISVKSLQQDNNPYSLDNLGANLLSDVNKLHEHVTSYTTPIQNCFAEYIPVEVSSFLTNHGLQFISAGAIFTGICLMFKNINLAVPLEGNSFPELLKTYYNRVEGIVDGPNGPEVIVYHHH